MREATDLAISAGIRRELSGRRIDLTKLKFPVKAGVVSLQGELCFVGLEKTTDETAVELKFIESSLKNLPGVKEIVFELTNWSINDSGIWESSSAASAHTGSAAMLPDGEGIVCPDCDYVIRFCPCCGKPLAGADKAAASRPRKALLSARPIIKKKRPASQLLSPVIRPATPGAPANATPDSSRNVPASGSPFKPASPSMPVIRPAGAATNEPAKISTPVEPAKPAMPAMPPVTGGHATSSQAPAFPGGPAKQTAAVPPARPGFPAATAPVEKSPASPASKPAMPAPPTIKPAMPTTGFDKPTADKTPAVMPATAKPLPAAGQVSPTRPTTPVATHAKPEIPAELPPEEDISTPDFGNFALSGEDLPSSDTDDPDLDNIFGSLKSELPGAVKPAMPVKPAAPVKPAQPAKPVPDFNFDDLISNSDSGDNLSESENSSAATSFETPAFDLGSLGDLKSTPANSQVPGENFHSFEPAQPAAPEEDETPLPPMRPAGAKPLAPASTKPVVSGFEDDDTPLPPMRPATPHGKEAKGKDLFAALFSDTDLNLGLPADGSGQGKNPFGNLDLEIDVLEVFPGNDEPAPPAPAPGKKPPAPAKPAPADDNPFNLDNIIDLDSPVEEKSPSKKKGSKEPLDLDDFDISKFKL